jgi:hypothetical protein
MTIKIDTKVLAAILAIALLCALYYLMRDDSTGVAQDMGGGSACPYLEVSINSGNAPQSTIDNYAALC